MLRQTRHDGSVRLTIQRCLAEQSYCTLASEHFLARGVRETIATSRNWVPGIDYDWHRSPACDCAHTNAGAIVNLTPEIAPMCFVFSYPLNCLMFVNRWTFNFYWLLLLSTTLAISAVPIHAASTEIDWQGVEDRRWPGREIWANRLQDWSVVDGQLQCAYEYGGRDWRTAHVLTHDVDPRGDHVKVELDFRAAANGHMGVLLGGGEGKLNYKQASMIQGVPGLGGGFVIDVAWSTKKLCIRDFGSDAEVKIPVPIAEISLPATVKSGSSMTLVVEGQRLDTEKFSLTATLRTNGISIAQTQTEVPAERLVGNVAIVSMDGTLQSPHQFTRVRLVGECVASHPERAYGPIAGVL